MLIHNTPWLAPIPFSGWPPGCGFFPSCSCHFDLIVLLFHSALPSRSLWSKVGQQPPASCPVSRSAAFILRPFSLQEAPSQQPKPCGVLQLGHFCLTQDFSSGQSLFGNSSAAWADFLQGALWPRALPTWPPLLYRCQTCLVVWSLSPPTLTPLLFIFHRGFLNTSFAHLILVWCLLPRGPNWHSW